MTDQPDYRFKMEIVDQALDNALVVDFASLTGASTDRDWVIQHVHRALDHYEAARAKYEAENYPDNDKQLVTQTAARIRAAAEG